MPTTLRTASTSRNVAEGRSTAAIEQRLFLSESAVGKHIANLFGKLDLAASDDDNHRVLAVLAYLNSAPR